MRYFIITVLSWLMAVNAECPLEWKTDTRIQDFVMLMDRVSWPSDAVGQIINGKNASYLQVAQNDGLYDTRMRVYTSDDNDTVFFIFRPTQQTEEGGKIHQDIRLVPVQFLSLTTLDVGYVHERFQQAFMSILQNSDVNVKTYKNIYVGGHSLGGALSIFMLMHMVYNIGIIPDKVIGLAGPFIGDEEFNNRFQKPLLSSSDIEWFQVYTQIESSPSVQDGTISGYNSSSPPFIYYNPDLVCSFSISNQLPDSYGMHDIKNYISWFD